MIKKIAFIFGISFSAFAHESLEPTELNSDLLSHVATCKEMEAKAPLIISEIIEIFKKNPALISFGSSNDKSLDEILTEASTLEAHSLQLICQDYFYQNPVLTFSFLISKKENDSFYSHFIDFTVHNFNEYCQLRNDLTKK